MNKNNINIKLIKEFNKEHGHDHPPLKKNSLGRWTVRQRENYKKSNLTKERIEILNSISFEW